MFILNFAVNYIAVGALTTVVWILCTNTLDWPAIIFFTSIAVGLIVLFFLSSWGDRVSRMPFRPLSQRESDYVMPMFNDIFSRTNLKTPPVLLMSDDPKPNGMVIGNNTMVLTRGLLAECTPKEVGAVIAHEFGHIINGDSRKKQIGYAINKAGDLTLGVAFGLIMIVSNNGQRILFFPFIVIALVLKVIRSILARIMLFGFYAIDRKSEYNADQFVKELGLEEGLILYLEKLEDNPGFIFNRTHPFNKDRIKMLQRYSVTALR
jgi:Zn-dependent protease with chaperone function